MERIICPLFKKTVLFDFVYTANIDQSAPKLGDTYVQQNLNEFDNGSYWTGTTGVIFS